MCLAPAGVAATTAIAGGSGLTVTVDPAGAYDILLPNPAWHFGGNLGAALTNIAVASGIDAVGAYSEIGFDFTSSVKRHAAIRAYANQPAVLFTLSYPAAAASLAFPSLTQYPAGLNHLAYSGTFAPPTFTTLAEESPWIFFDASANTFVLSPAANFMAANLSKSASGTISSGLVWTVPALPAGFSHATLLVMGTGINRTVDVWGSTLTAITGKKRPSNQSDATLKLLGYWTDNGATYYYHMENPLSYMATLSAVKADFDTRGIGLGYLQLDSWFYPKGAQAQWSDSADGIYQYWAASDLFGSSLASFQQSLGVPLVTHARWLDPSSPYRQQYAISGNVSTDPAYWNMVAGYLSSAGVTTYEQDWLSAQAQTASNLTDPPAFLGNMSAAMASSGMTMQYCMPTTRHVMASAAYSNLTTIRGANDRFNPDRWTPFLYASRLIGAVGAWPFADVLMSTETSNLLLSTLSAGPIGLGDKLGTLSSENVLRSVRQDGVIVKPDVPASPLDATILADSASPGTAPMVAATYTDFGSLRASYVFAYPQATTTAFQFRVADLGWNGSAYLYDYFQRTGRVVAATDVISESIAGDSLYLVAAPIGLSGIAVIGDTGHFVTLGKQRIAELSDDGAVHLKVAFASGENSRTIVGFSPRVAPRVSASEGTASAPIYDRATGRFSVVVTPSENGVAVIRFDPVRGRLR